jgi:hypothetical protein
MKNFGPLLAGTALALATLASEVFAAPKGPTYDHVLMISVDGLHAIDLSNYIASHPKSTLATLCRQRCPVSQCVDDGTVGFVSRPAGSDDGRHIEIDRRVL